MKSITLITCTVVRLVRLVRLESSLSRLERVVNIGHACRIRLCIYSYMGAIFEVLCVRNSF